MAKTENESLNKKETPHGESYRTLSMYEDEIDLMGYLVVIWRYKYFICIATALSTIMISAALLFLPGNYEVTYVYDMKDDAEAWNFTSKNFDVLFNRFYSEDNLERLKDVLQTHGLGKYTRFSGPGYPLTEFVEFEAVPPFLDISKMSITRPEDINTLKTITALLLNVTISAESREDASRVSSIIRDNLENLAPLYAAQEQLSVYTRECNTYMARIERSRFDLKLQLKNHTEILAELKKVHVGYVDTQPSNIVLQFDSNQGQYLPLSYQIQATESKLIELKKTIELNEEKYAYYKDMLDLNNRILSELDKYLFSGDGNKHFKLFLINLADSYEKAELKDYLNSCIRKFENGIAAIKPVTEKPAIISRPRGIVKKAGIVFSGAFLLSILTAFLRDSYKKSKSRFCDH